MRLDQTQTLCPVAKYKLTEGTQCHEEVSNNSNNINSTGWLECRAARVGFYCPGQQRPNSICPAPACCWLLLCCCGLGTGHRKEIDWKLLMSALSWLSCRGGQDVTLDCHQGLAGTAKSQSVNYREVILSPTHKSNRSSSLCLWLWKILVTFFLVKNLYCHPFSKEVMSNN